MNKTSPGSGLKGQRAPRTAVRTSVDKQAQARMIKAKSDRQVSTIMTIRPSSASIQPA